MSSKTKKKKNPLAKNKSPSRKPKKKSTSNYVEFPWRVVDKKNLPAKMMADWLNGDSMNSYTHYLKELNEEFKVSIMPASKWKILHLKPEPVATKPVQLKAYNKMAFSGIEVFDKSILEKSKPTIKPEPKRTRVIDLED